MKKFTKTQMIEYITQIDNIIERLFKNASIDRFFIQKLHNIDCYLSTNNLKKKNLAYVTREYQKAQLIESQINLIAELIIEEDFMNEYQRFLSLWAESFGAEYYQNKIAAKITEEKRIEKERQKIVKLNNQKAKLIRSKSEDQILYSDLEFLFDYCEINQEDRINWKIGYKHVTNMQSISDHAHNMKYMLHRANNRPAYNGPLAVLTQKIGGTISDKYNEDCYLVLYKQSSDTTFWANNPPEWHKSQFKGGSPYATSAGRRVKTKNFCDFTAFADSVIFVTKTDSYTEKYTHIKTEEELEKEAIYAYLNEIHKDRLAIINPYSDFNNLNKFEVVKVFDVKNDKICEPSRVTLEFTDEIHAHFVIADKTQQCPPPIIE